MKEVKRILVAEDEEMLLKSVVSICSIIEGLEIEVEAAMDGREALEKLRQSEKPFHLLLTDYKMPKMNGLQLIKAVRKEFPEVEIIMMTAYTDLQSAINVMKEGTFDYILKPFEGAFITAAVKRCLHHQEVEQRNRQLEQEVAEDLLVGKAIQKKFLTGAAQTIKVFEKIGLRVAIFNHAPATVSGDFFYAKSINGSAGFFFADTCGHGGAAAMISMRVVNFVETNDSPIASPREFLSRISRDISGIMLPGRNVAANYTIFHMDENVKHFTISNAGQPFPILLHADGRVQDISVAGFPLGQKKPTYKDKDYSFFPEDRLIFHTDGIIEAQNGNDELYGTKRLHACIKKKRKLPLEQFKDAIISDVRSFTGGTPFEDDITLAVFEMKKEQEE